MDQYFNQMDKVVQEKKTSSRVRFMLQDVIDLRKVRVKFFAADKYRKICEIFLSRILWFDLQCKWISNSKNTNSKTKTQFPGVQNVRGGRIARGLFYYSFNEKLTN